MGANVYANGNAVAGKVGGGKVIAAFPDVCNSPPSPPAGPIPLPYPNSSFSKDLKKGSKTVKAGGKPVALEDQSYYKTSPLGNEACTKALGMSLLTHTNAGKTYFAAFSMNVIFEGKKVCRHFDLATSNHASQPFSPPAIPNLENRDPAIQKKLDENGKCPCCNGPKHANQKNGATKIKEREWYGEDGMKKVSEARQRGCPNVPETPDSGCGTYYKVTSSKGVHRARKKFDNHIKPEFRRKYNESQKNSPLLKAERGATTEEQKQAQVCHKTPLVAGGCYKSYSNLAVRKDMDSRCQKLEDELGEIQGQRLEHWKNA